MDPGADFRCNETGVHQGPAEDACQVRCESEGCLAAYRACLNQSVCVAVHVNPERTFGTLKTSVQDGQEIIVVLSEGEWEGQLRPLLEPQWRSRHKPSHQHTLGPGVPHSAPYWRLEPPRPSGMFSFLGGL